METIRVYHSLWKNGLLVAVCFGFTAVDIFLINAGKNGIVAWLAILVFGIGGLFMLWLMLKERITHTPYYIITDDCIIMNSGFKTIKVHFADVERFFLTKVGTVAGAKTKLMGIQYKKKTWSCRNIKMPTWLGVPFATSTSVWLVHKKLSPQMA